MVLEYAMGSVENYSGVDAIVTILRRTGIKSQFDIGPISFTCEDSVQLRYLVTFTVSVSFSGNVFVVRDLSRVRIGGRPSEYWPSITGPI